MNQPIDISVVIPVFNEENNIQILLNELKIVLAKLSISWEIIFVDDGSNDKSFEIIQNESLKNSNVKGISLSRNFGHQIALLAGIGFSAGDAVITMDADMQHPPDIIPELYKKYKEGFDIVNTKRIDSHKTGVFKKTTSRFFYSLINFLSDVKIESASADFRLMNRKSVNAFLKLPERERFTRGLISWMGFRQTIINYQCNPRYSGESRYTISKMMRFALDGITSFSSKPLRISFYLGLLTFLSGFIYALYAVINFLRGSTVPGWTSILVSVLILGGIQLLSLGIIGEYIARIFNESKSRPAYLIKETTENIPE